MADLWCPGLAVEEYVSFLDALEFRARGALAEIDALEASLLRGGEAPPDTFTPKAFTP